MNRCSLLTLTVITAPVILSGCSTSPKTLSAGQIGCAPSQIEISNENTDWYAETWVATCKGKKFICTSDFSGYSRTTSCTEED